MPKTRYKTPLYGFTISYIYILITNQWQVALCFLCILLFTFYTIWIQPAKQVICIVISYPLLPYIYLFTFITIYCYWYICSCLLLFIYFDIFVCFYCYFILCIHLFTFDTNFYNQYLCSCFMLFVTMWTFVHFYCYFIQWIHLYHFHSIYLHMNICPLYT